jgi:ABC-type multidrug transport system ATPase subunit
MPAEVINAQVDTPFGSFAVDNVSCSERGEVVSYLGPNGSGKTTTIRMLLGLLLPSEGEQVLGYDIVKQAELIRSQVGYMSQNLLFTMS